MDIYELLEIYKSESYALSLEEERELIAKYVYSTNKLEGNSLTLAQTKSIIEEGKISGDEIKIKDILEQKGTYKALIRVMNAVANKEALSVELMKELNWLTIGSLFQADYYQSYKEAGQQIGKFKVKNNRILLTLPNGEKQYVEPLSNENNVKFNMDLLVRQLSLSEKSGIEKGSYLAQELWLHQPFIDGNKRTARLLINFITMREGFPLFTYEEEGVCFNDMLVKQYTLRKDGLIQDFIEASLHQQMIGLLDIDEYNSY